MRRPSLELVGLLLLLLPASLRAQVDAGALAERFTRMTAVSGFERAALDSVQALLPGARRDRAGDVVLERGSGAATLIVCPFDEAGYVVGGIRDDGWLTLRRVGRAPNALFDQYHEGQRIMLWGRHGALPGVIAVHSTHLQRGRGGNEAPFNVDDAFVDIGASSGVEARAAGAGLLSPVAREKQPFRYGDGLLAGPDAGRRGACAALVAAAATAGAPSGGRLVVAVAVEQELGQRGLRTLAHNAGPFSRTIIVDGTAGAAGSIAVRADTVATRVLPELGQVARWGLTSRNTGTPVETVSLTDIEALRVRLVAEMGGGR
ncbi:MAG TPA: hypothetical protein VFI13_01450 [Gemmatimonadales bacterium]|nr:hypothetical protein [Gemmatimonadales bacterium]